MHVEWSPQAQQDLRAIALYIAKDNPEAAVAWVRKLRERADKACVAPRAGRMVPELKDAAIREVRLRTYRIIYRIEEHRLFVLTVFEGHRQLRPLK